MAQIASVAKPLFSALISSLETQNGWYLLREHFVAAISRGVGFVWARSIMRYNLVTQAESI